MSFEKDRGLNQLPATTDVSTARSLKSRQWTVHGRARSRLRTVQSEERFLIRIPRSVCLQPPAAHVDYPLKRRFVVRRRRLLWINSFQDLRNGCSYMIAGKSALYSVRRYRLGVERQRCTSRICSLNRLLCTNASRGGQNSSRD